MDPIISPRLASFQNDRNRLLHKMPKGPAELLYESMSTVCGPSLFMKRCVESRMVIFLVGGSVISNRIDMCVPRQVSKQVSVSKQASQSLLHVYKDILNDGMDE